MVERWVASVTGGGGGSDRIGQSRGTQTYQLKVYHLLAFVDVLYFNTLVLFEWFLCDYLFIISPARLIQTLNRPRSPFLSRGCWKQAAASFTLLSCATVRTHYLPFHVSSGLTFMPASLERFRWNVDLHSHLSQTQQDVAFTEISVSEAKVARCKFTAVDTTLSRW